VTLARNQAGGDGVRELRSLLQPTDLHQARVGGIGERLEWLPMQVAAN
jgi:hypothetical protein